MYCNKTYKVHYSSMKNVWSFFSRNEINSLNCITVTTIRPNVTKYNNYNQNFNIEWWVIKCNNNNTSIVSQHKLTEHYDRGWAGSLVRTELRIMVAIDTPCDNRMAITFSHAVPNRRRWKTGQRGEENVDL